MCTRHCTHIWNACDECIEEACQGYTDNREHKAILAIVPASDDEWRKRLDEMAPLVTSLPSPQSPQGISDAQR